MPVGPPWFLLPQPFRVRAGRGFIGTFTRHETQSVSFGMDAAAFFCHGDKCAGNAKGVFYDN